MFVRATLKDGTQVISEFDKMSKLRRYANDVMSGHKQLAIWVPLADAHPVSGEPMTIRGRRFVRGDLVNELAFVEPIQPEHGFAPENFRLAAHYESRVPFWTAPAEDTPEGAVAGVRYPIHRDSDTQRRYVILLYNELPEAQTRHWLDAEAGITQPFGVDADDEPSETDEEWEDEDWEDED